MEGDLDPDFLVNKVFHERKLRILKLDYQNNEIKIKLKANETKIIEEVAVEVQAAQSCRPPPDYKEKKRQGKIDSSFFSRISPQDSLGLSWF